MKYKPKDYAKALSELILKEVTASQEKKLLDNFLKLLKKNGDISKIKKIIDLAETLFFKKTGRKKVILETVREINSKQKRLLESLIGKGDIVQERISKDLIAGVKIIVNDEKQIDFSMQKKLENIF